MLGRPIGGEGGIKGRRQKIQLVRTGEGCMKAKAF